MLNFYLAPLERKQNSRAPRLLKWRRNQSGINCRWSLKDFGAPDIGVVITDAAINNPEYIALARGSKHQRDVVRGTLKNFDIEATWIDRAPNDRELIQRALGMAFAHQANDDQPEAWCGREIHFGFGTLAPLDREMYLREQAERAKQVVEHLRVQWSASKPRFDWRGTLRVLADNPLMVFALALPATDAFTDTDGVLLTTHSASWTAKLDRFIINSNAVYCESNGQAFAHWNADTFNDNQYSQVYIAAIASGKYLGPSVRNASGTTLTLYYAEGDSGDGLYLFKQVTGTETQLGSTGGVVSATDTLRLESSGTTITLKKNGSTASPPGAQTDSAIASGAAGLCGYGTSTSARMDNWEGGNLDGGLALLNQKQNAVYRM